MIAIVDLGLGNLHSVRWAFERIGAQALPTCERDALEAADALILPGVGHFQTAAYRLAQLGIAPLLRRRAQEVPFLGICLGMQLLFDWSEEGGRGLGLLEGGVRALSAPGLPLPHTGWNGVEVQPGSGMLKEVGSGEAYFVHRYAAEPKDSRAVAAWTDYGGRFASAVQQGLVLGTQFHPERSGAYGRRILTRFLEEVTSCSRSSPRSTSPEGTSCA